MKGIFYACDLIVYQSQVCDHRTPKCDLCKIQACDGRTAKQNIACVGVCACDCTPLTARPAFVDLIFQQNNILILNFYLVMTDQKYLGKQRQGFILDLLQSSFANKNAEYALQEFINFKLKLLTTIIILFYSIDD